MHDDNITQETPNEGLGKEHPTPSPKSIVLKHSEISAFIRGKRIAAFDFGKVRTGFAVCDEFHITVSTKGIFQTADKEFYPSILAALERERIGL
ncbi:MAG: hypothetical protein JNL32_15330, partial [Candidatus Kapabacteria bacterium]|nr:hypothetical protein [Candidatus Kapabacteria bacterium]